MEMEEDQNPGNEAEMTPHTKEPYVKPELTVHGTVQELTQNLGLIGTDGLLGSRLT
jgi:hypothetical protein